MSILLKETKIINRHRNMNCEEQGRYVANSRKYQKIVNHVIEYNENDVIITMAVKMNRNDPECKKLLNDMEEKCESPISAIFKELKREKIRFNYSNPLEDEEKENTP